MKNALLAFLGLLVAGLSGCSGGQSGTLPVVNADSGNIPINTQAEKIDNSANHATIQYGFTTSLTNTLNYRPNLDADVNQGFKPAALGNVEFQFNVANDAGQPVSGADLEVFAEHSNMSGMTIQVKAVDRGNGLYMVDTQFSMPGIWKVTVKVKQGSLEHRQDIILKII